MENIFELPINHKILKYLLRKGVSNLDRATWWLILPKLDRVTPLTEFPDSIASADRLYTLLNVNSLPGEDSNSVQHVLSILQKNSQLEITETIKELMNLCSSYISTRNLQLLFAFDLLSCHSKYVTITKLEHFKRLHTFKCVLKEYLPKTSVVLQNIGALDDKYLNLIFIRFFQDIFPINFCYQIIDCFLLEGVKILYRFGISLIRMFKRQIKNNDFKNGYEFWLYLSNNYLKLEILTEEFTVTLKDFAFESNRSTMSKAHRPMKIGKKFLILFSRIAEIEFGNLPEKRLNELTSIYDFISVPSDNIEIETKQDLIPTKIQETKILSTDDIEKINELMKQSKILSYENTSELYEYLDDATRFTGFQLIFSSSTNGYNMETLYELSENLNGCLILIKIVNDSVIGFYTNSTISPPSHHVRGDGMTFIFKLDGKNSLKYSWIGRTEPEETELSDNETKQQFLICFHEYILVGGSKIKGTNAIRIDSELRTCCCGYSDTFNNPPMLNNGEPIDIETIEVLHRKN